MNSRTVPKSSSALRHSALLLLRSVIFTQIFDKIADESIYSQTPWYRITPAGHPARRMRFCQAKFFIIGNRDEAKFPQAMIDAINKAARELHQHFDDMSKYGKEGASNVLVETCYRDTLASFANALRLRSEVQKSYP
jgi:hypothetical protein